MSVSSLKSTKKLTLSQLESFLLESANILRGKLDPSEFKDYVFGMLFLKHLSDAFDEEKENEIQYYLDQEINKGIKLLRIQRRRVNQLIHGISNDLLSGRKRVSV